MKMLYSNPDCVRKMAMLRAKQLAMFSPTIPFEKPKKKKDEEEDDKDKYKSFDIKLSVQEDDDSKVMCKSCCTFQWYAGGILLLVQKLFRPSKTKYQGTSTGSKCIVYFTNR